MAVSGQGSIWTTDLGSIADRVPLVPCTGFARFARLKGAEVGRSLPIRARAAPSEPTNNHLILFRKNGGRYKDRTCDPFHVKEVLYR